MSSDLADDPLDDDELLADVEARERINKLRVETEILSHQLSEPYRKRESLKAYMGLGGLITAIVGIVALFVSVAQWRQEVSEGRELRADERLDLALQSLSGDSAKQRLSGVVSLRSFLDGETRLRQDQVLLSLTHAIAIEEDAVVRNAIIRVISNLKSNYVKKHALDEALLSLVQSSRLLVREGDLRLERRSNPFFLAEGNSIEARAHDVGQCIESLLQKGVRTVDLSGTYLVQRDFHAINLRGVKFDDAILAWADFTDCELVNASFDGADLEDAVFKNTNLKNAKLTLIARPGPGEYRRSYIELSLARGKLTTQGPDFTNADLSGADFSGHMLFGFLPDGNEFLLPGNFFPPVFHKAKLDKTDFRNIAIFALTREGEEWDEPLTFINGGSSPILKEFLPDAKEVRIHEAQLTGESKLTPSAKSYKESLSEIEYAFKGSNWDAALLPKGIRQQLLNGGTSKSE